MKLLKIIILLFAVSNQNYSQYIYSPFIRGITSLDIPVDARNIAMGESFVANSLSSLAYKSNPATLSNNKGLNIIYSNRKGNWVERLKDFNYNFFGITLNTSFGNIAVDYIRSYYPEIEFQYYKLKDADDLITISYSYGVLENLSIGINLKSFKRKRTIEGEERYIKRYSFTTKQTYLFDFGALYQLQGIIKNESLIDNLNIGFSLQNFGTNYKEKYVDQTQGNYYEYNTPSLPRYLRIGFNYNLYVGNEKQCPFSFSFTGEYGNYLNARDIISYDGYYYNCISYGEKSGKDYWGTGMEVTFYDILSLRLGGVAYPYWSVFGEKGKLTIRYGFGIILPLEKFFVKIPLSISFDFAFIPIKQMGGLENTIDQKRNITAFNIQLSYNNPLF